MNTQLHLLLVSLFLLSACQAEDAPLPAAPSNPAATARPLAPGELSEAQTRAGVTCISAANEMVGRSLVTRVNFLDTTRSKNEKEFQDGMRALGNQVVVINRQRSLSCV